MNVMSDNSHCECAHCSNPRGPCGFCALVDEVERLSPKWTTEAPKVAGWYWCRRIPGHQDATAMALTVTMLTDGSCEAEIGDDVLTADECRSCEWAGPIAPRP